MNSKIVKKIPEGYKQTEIGIIPEDWDIEPIKQLALITTGSKNTQDRLSEGLYPFFVRSQKIERINSYSYDGEAVLTAGDGVGTGKVFHYINGKFDIHQRVYKISDFNKKLNGYFFFLYFSKNFFKRIVHMTAKSSVDSVRMEMIADMQIPIPTKTEQIAIATVLSDTDALIERLGKLIAKRKAIKQGVMQQLLTGKKRLPGFSGEWEVKKLPEVVWFQEGPGVRNSQFTNSGVKLLNGTNIEDGKLLLEKTDRYISEKEAFGWYSHFLVDDGDILIACSGVTIDKFQEKVTIASQVNLPLCMNTSTMRFKIVSSILSKDFFFYFLKSKSFKEQIGGKATGSAQLNFGPSHVKMVEIALPKPKEQTAIATILSDMDAEIESLEQKRDKYTMLKQGMMQQLLTGRIRLYANN